MQIAHYKRGEYQRGHGIRCRHCGHSFDEHQKPESVRHPEVIRRGFRSSFSRCRRYGYEPANLKTWERRERTHEEKEQRDFEMQCYERQAQGRAAWGQYAAHVQHTNYHRELRGLEESVARSSGDRDGSESRERLVKLLKDRRARATVLYVG